MKRGIFFAVFVSCVFAWGNGYALDLDLRGQLSGWTIQSGQDDEWRNQTGGRYLPQLTLEHALTDISFVDLEASLNGYAVYDTEDSGRGCGSGNCTD